MTDNPKEEATTSPATPPLLEVRDLRIRHDRGGRSGIIVSKVDLDIRPGETLGIVGESGSGKSMTAKAIVGLLPPGVTASGFVGYEGRQVLDLPERERSRLRGRELGLALQDPFTLLNPLLPAGEQILESVRGPDGRRLRGDPARAEAVGRLAEVGIRDPSVVDRYPFQLSGGMRQRVGLAAALAADPRVLIADEPATALDVTTQKEILELLVEIQRTRGMAVILITHDLRVAFSTCDRIAVLYAGRLLEHGRASQLESLPLHPYTLGLLGSEPAVERRLERLAAIPGNVPSPDEVADRCAFASRCPWVDDGCLAGQPELASLPDGRASACRRTGEIADELIRVRTESAAATEVAVVAASPPTLLTVTSLNKRFAGRRRRSVVAVEDVSIVVGRGESVGLVGESGSGKTTTARCVVGLEAATSGEIVFSTPEGDQTVGYRDRDGRHVAQMVFQDPYSTLNPRRNVNFALAEALRIRGEKRDEMPREIAALLARVGLPESYRTRRPAQLSGGERQRVAIARALAVAPQLVVCDEPVSALDVSVQAQILNVFNDLRRELALSYLFITHDLAVVRQVVDRVYVMCEGRIVEEGRVDEVLDNPRHKYTQRLVAAIPRSAPPVERDTPLMEREAHNAKRRSH